MKKKDIRIVLTISILIVVAISLTLIPKQIRGTLTVANGTGETATVEYDLLYYSNFILPSYVKGTLTVDGVEYIDQYSLYKLFPSVKDNELIPSDWWQAENSVPYNMTFVRSDCTNVTSAQINRINVLDIVLDKGIRAIHFMYSDESNAVNGAVSGVSFWGPAQNAKEVAQISEFFGYSAP